MSDCNPDWFDITPDIWSPTKVLKKFMLKWKQQERIASWCFLFFMLQWFLSCSCSTAQRKQTYLRCLAIRMQNKQTFSLVFLSPHESVFCSQWNNKHCDYLISYEFHFLKTMDWNLFRHTSFRFFKDFSFWCCSTVNKLLESLEKKMRSWVFYTPGECSYHQAIELVSGLGYLSSSNDSLKESEWTNKWEWAHPHENPTVAWRLEHWVGRPRI